MKPCVYTTLLGQYEQLNEQPLAMASDWRFICFTDDPRLTSTTWDIRLIEPLFAADIARSQRQIKILAHQFLPEHDVSLYIDNSVRLKVLPEDILAQWTLSSGLSLFSHSDRETVMDEFLEVIRLGLDDQATLLEQLNHFQMHHPETLKTQPIWSAMMLRRHHEPQVSAAMERWFQLVLRYSRRDQLSSNLAFAQCGLMPNVVAGSNLDSWCHSWPHALGRDRHSPRFNPLTGQLPALARVRQAELAQRQEEQAQKVRHEEDRTRTLARLLYNQYYTD